jgi:hypothetical protein
LQFSFHRLNNFESEENPIKNNLSASSRLLLSSAKHILTSSSRMSNDQIEPITIEEKFNFNSLLFIPFMKLMINKKIDSHLKDAVIIILFFWPKWILIKKFTI